MFILHIIFSSELHAHGRFQMTIINNTAIALKYCMSNCGLQRFKVNPIRKNWFFLYCKHIYYILPLFKIQGFTMCDNNVQKVKKKNKYFFYPSSHAGVVQHNFSSALVCWDYINMHSLTVDLLQVPLCFRLGVWEIFDIMRLYSSFPLFSVEDWNSFLTDFKLSH